MLECTSNATSSPRWPLRPARVLLVGEQPVVLMGLALLFQSAPAGIEVLGTVNRIVDLQFHAALEEADILFIDLGRRRTSSIAFLPALMANGATKVVVFVDDHDAAQHEEAVSHGAVGVVLKSSQPEAVLAAIVCVHAGEAWVERSLMASLIRGRGQPLVTQPAGGGEHVRRIAQLTQKEREVIASVVAHRGDKGFIVAESLGISEHTLRNRLTFIYDKLHIRGKLNLYLYALEHGLGPAQPPRAAEGR